MNVAGDKNPYILNGINAFECYLRIAVDAHFTSKLFVFVLFLFGIVLLDV